MFSFVSFGIALFGLSTIISASIPVLMFLYPLTIVLILLALTGKLHGGAHSIYAWTIGLTVIPSLYAGFHTAGIALGGVDAFVSSLPFATYDMAWISFSVVGFIVGLVVSKIKG